MSLFRPRATAFGGRTPPQRWLSKDWLDHRPGRLNGDFTVEQSAVAGHGVIIEKPPFVGRFLSRLFFEQVAFSLVAHGVATQRS